MELFSRWWCLTERRVLKAIEGDFNYLFLIKFFKNFNSGILQTIPSAGLAKVYENTS